MIVAIHQPNFIPWLGFFKKISMADIFVIIDDVQFVKGSICNRNKIKNNQGQAMWITLPVSNKKGLKINFNEIEIDYNQKWQIKMLNQIKSSYSKAPYFNKYFAEIEEIFETNFNVLSEINIELIRYFCKSLEINTPIKVTSELDQNFGISNERNLNITKHFKGTTYLSGAGAKKYNNEELFLHNNIKLLYLEYDHPIYKQQWGEFQSQLSILDLLLNEGPNSKNILQG